MDTPSPSVGADLTRPRSRRPFSPQPKGRRSQWQRQLAPETRLWHGSDPLGLSPVLQPSAARPTTRSWVARPGCGLLDLTEDRPLADHGRPGYPQGSGLSRPPAPNRRALAQLGHQRSRIQIRMDLHDFKLSGTGVDGILRRC